MNTLPAYIEYGNRKVLLKYHRLLSGANDQPPNSIEALDDILAKGARVIELDIRLAADSRFVLLHDATLQRETRGVGPVGAISAEDFRELRLRNSDAKGATFAEAIDRIARVEHPIKLQIDLKHAEPLSQEGLEALAADIERLRTYPNVDVVVGCLADWNLRKLRERLPELALGVDFAFHLDAPVDGIPRLPTRVNAYGYLDDHPLGFFGRAMSAPDYLADRFEVMLGLLPGAAEFYVRKELLEMSLKDGFNPVAFLHEKCPGALVDIWTIDPDTETGRDHLFMALEAGADQITTNMPVLAASIAAAR